VVSIVREDVHAQTPIAAGERLTLQKASRATLRQSSARTSQTGPNAASINDRIGEANRN